MAALDLDKLEAALDAEGIAAYPEDGEDTSRVHSAAGGWEFADSTCRYATHLLKVWPTDVPKAGRHQWLLSQLVRLSAAHRLGCITKDGHTAAVAILTKRFTEVCAAGEPSRTPTRNEVTDAHRAAVAIVETKTDERARQELGDHDHQADTDTPPELEAGKFASVPLGRKLAREALTGDVIYVTNLGWHKWDSTRWQPVPDDTIMALAADWVEEELIALIRSGADMDSKVVRTMLRYREVGNVRQLLAGARTEPAIVVTAADLDSHEGLLNCANGVLNLTNGELGPHDPALMLTKTTGVKYLPGASHSDWDKTLKALPDDETAIWLQTYLGAAATGERDRGGPVVIAQGDGANGKTTVQGGVMHAFGEYAVLVPDKLLTGSGNEHDTLWMPLQGARLACIEELPEGHQMPVSRIKKLADTPSITGRHIGRDYVTFPATHSLMVNTNYRPRVTETDHGTWRRLVMVEYGKTFDGDAKDATLKRRLRQVAQAQAVLAWIVEGARLWYANGRTTAEPSAAMSAATDDWRSESDPLAVFLDEQIEFTGNDDNRIPTSDLLTSFNAWLPYGTRAWSSSLFGSRLKAHPKVKEAGATVDRGHRNKEKTALTRAIWAGSAQGAQGHFRGSQGNSSHEKHRHPPAHPAQPEESDDQAATVEAIAEQLEVG